MFNLTRKEVLHKIQVMQDNLNEFQGSEEEKEVCARDVKNRSSELMKMLKQAKE